MIEIGGIVNWVRIDLEEDDLSHLEPAEPKPAGFSCANSLGANRLARQ